MPVWINVAIGSVLAASLVTSLYSVHTIAEHNKSEWKSRLIGRMYLNQFGVIKLYGTIVATIFYISFNIFG